LTEESVEGCSDDDCGEHEGDGGQCAEKGFATKVEAGEEVGGGESEEKRKKSGEDSLVEGEAYCVIRNSYIFGGQGFKIESKCEDFGKREEEKEGEERERQEPEENAICRQVNT
jgi:hypothetical protein